MSWRPLLPREHGAWAMFLVPFAVGAGVAETVGWETLLLLLATLFLFAARYPASLLAKASARQPTGRLSPRRPFLWLAIYVGLGLLFGAPLLWPYGRWALLPLGALGLLFWALHLYLQGRRLERTAWGELLAIAGLSLAAPAAYYGSRGALDRTAFSLWLLTFLYSGSSVFYVKMTIQHLAAKARPSTLAGRWALGRAAALYQGFLLVVATSLALGGSAPPLALVAFVPLTFKVARGVLLAPAAVSVRHIGFGEVGHAVLFTVLLLLAYRLGPHLA